jgi:hypothetical protein
MPNLRPAQRQGITHTNKPHWAHLVGDIQSLGCLIMSVTSRAALILTNGGDNSKPRNAWYDMKRIKVPSCNCSNNGIDQSTP